MAYPSITLLSFIQQEQVKQIVRTTKTTPITVVKSVVFVFKSPF